MDHEKEQLLATCEPAVAELTRETCDLIQGILPSAVVTVEGGDIGYGTAPGYKGLVFTVSPHRQHVTLGIAGGAALPDPAGLMEGKGKVHRHIKIRDRGDVESPALRELLIAAADRRR